MINFLGWDCIVIYDRPKDFPEHVVTRWWFIDQLGQLTLTTRFACIHESIEDARSHMPFTAIKVERLPEEDDNIVEKWFDKRRNPHDEVTLTHRSIGVIDFWNKLPDG